MEHHSEAFVALDTAKLRNSVAIADAGCAHRLIAGRSGEIRYFGEFDNTEVATRKFVAQLARKHARLTAHTDERDHPFQRIATRYSDRSRPVRRGC